jgi:sugar phosphate isomerase/epimerase
VRRAGTTAAVALIQRASEFGVTAVTLCTGSRDPERMWTAHPGNTAPEAWHDLRTELDLLLEAAGAAGVRLGVEPEPGNVVRDAAAAARLLAQLGRDADRITIIADAANLLREHAGESRAAQAAVLERAFEVLGETIGCLHAKDLVPWHETLAGRGVVDYELVGRLRRTLPHAAPVIVQDARAEEAAAVRELVASAIGPDATDPRGS